MAFNTLPIFLSPVFLLLPNIQCVFSIPVNIGFPRYATKGSAHCCNAVRLVYAFTPHGTFRSELNIGIGRPNQGTTLLSSEDKHHTSDANQLWESHNAEDDSLRASIGRHQGSSVRLLIVDAVSAMMLHKRMGPSVHVNMMVRVRFDKLIVSRLQSSPYFKQCCAVHELHNDNVMHFFPLLVDSFPHLF